MAENIYAPMSISFTMLTFILNSYIICFTFVHAESHMMEQFESDGVLVTLEWHQNPNFHSYYVSVIPNNIIVMRTNGSVHLMLKVPYNTFYNISILAALPCGENMTDFTELFYREFLVTMLLWS